tara:strand:+ start:3556 stop:3774 length:219 start_codon:yes stop_codon:yes gene_type:complete
MSSKSRVHLSTHYDDEDQRRRADIVLENNEYYVVDFYEDGELVESKIMQTDGYYHSESYAESAAENWCLGYM